ncbi:hypothetical protein WAX74_17460 [Psychrobacillus sp. FJAT-51614]|uniref:Uncharacterized protein n=1 Tax=Psychrobacillus mangrovi TaxID=3117745 RepID=A0ABU8FB01_9BACI
MFHYLRQTFSRITLGISAEELKQTVIGLVAQKLVTVSYAKQPELSAIFEIISDELLMEALNSLLSGAEFKIPYSLTLSYQIERGVREGVIQKN